MYFASALFILILGLFIFAQSALVKADPVNVLDKASVMRQSDINKINDINNNELSRVKGHPQVAVITINHTDDIEDYAQNMFDKYKFGRSELDNGVLIVLAIRDHKVRIQTGYGVESALPDLWCSTDATSGTVKQLLRNQDYGKAAVLITKRVAKRLAREEGVIKSAQQVAQHKREKVQEERLFAEILCWALIIFVFGAIAVGLYKVWQVHLENAAREAAFKKRMKMRDDVINSALAKKYDLTQSDLKTDGLAYNMFMYSSSIDNASVDNVAKSCVLAKALATSLIDYVFSTDSIYVVAQTAPHFDTVMERLSYLTKSWRGQEHEMNNAIFMLFEHMYNIARDNMTEAGDLVSRYNLALTKLKYDDIDNLEQSNDDLVQNLQKRAVLDFISSKNNSDVLKINPYDVEKEQIEGQFNKTLLQHNFDCGIRDLEANTNLDAYIDSGPNYNAFTKFDAYDNMNAEDKSDYNTAIAAGDYSVAEKLLLLSFAAMAVDLLQRTYREKNDHYQDYHNSDNDDDDDFWNDDSGFGSGSFGGFDSGDSFGGFGGASGGGGGTSSW